MSRMLGNGVTHPLAFVDLGDGRRNRGDRATVDQQEEGLVRVQLEATTTSESNSEQAFETQTQTCTPTEWSCWSRQWWDGRAPRTWSCPGLAVASRHGNARSPQESKCAQIELLRNRTIVDIVCVLALLGCRLRISSTSCLRWAVEWRHCKLVSI